MVLMTDATHRCAFFQTMNLQYSSRTAAGTRAERTLSDNFWMHLSRFSFADCTEILIWRNLQAFRRLL